MEDWLKSIGVAGFLFFLVKGLLWLIIPYLVSRGIIKRRKKARENKKEDQEEPKENA